MLWSVISSSPALDVHTDRVYVGSWDSNMYALDGKTGSEIYRVTTRDHIYASPALDKSRDRVYVTSTDGCLYAVKASTGKVEWTYDTLMPIRSSPSVSSDGVVFFGNAASMLFAVNPDGTRRFSVDLTRDPSRKGINSSPALGPASVLVGAFDGHIWSVGYDHCTSQPSSAGCSVKSAGDIPTTDGAYLYWASDGGGMVHGPVWSNVPSVDTSVVDLPPTAAHGTPTLYLYVRHNGQAVEVAVHSNSSHVP